MARRLKLLTGLSTVALAGAAVALGACSGGEGGEGAKTVAQGEGGEGAAQAEGEGEGARGDVVGEGDEGMKGPGDPATDDAAYLTQLALVRGHLFAFHELYKAGAYDAASIHMKHPQSELYAGLVPAFKARGNDGFADALDTLSAANEKREGVDDAYAAAIEAIKAAGPKPSVKTDVVSVAQIAKTAAGEYEEGVGEDGAVKTVKEYQDAYGFMSVAKQILDNAEPQTDAERDALATAKAQVDDVLKGFNGWQPDHADMHASALYGAAARLEIAGMGLS